MILISKSHWSHTYRITDLHPQPLHLIRSIICINPNPSHLATRSAPIHISPSGDSCLVPSPLQHKYRRIDVAPVQLLVLWVWGRADQERKARGVWEQGIQSMATRLDAMPRSPFNMAGLPCCVITAAWGDGQWVRCGGRRMEAHTHVNNQGVKVPVSISIFNLRAYRHLIMRQVSR
jgi:hypothetical protein